MNNHQERMGREPIVKLIFYFALPSIAGMLANSLYNIVDRIFVGRIVGAGGLAAVSVCFPAMLFMFSICLLIGVGSAPLISMALGEGDKAKAERVLGSTVSLATFIGIVLLLLGSFYLDYILMLSGVSSTILPMAREYLKIIFLGAPFSIIAFAINFCIRAEGHPNFAMFTQILGAVCNIILDAIFIGCLDMGIAGAAWGTIISQFISMIWVLSFYLRGKSSLKLSYKNLKPRPALIFKILTLGFSPCMSELSFTVFSVFFNRALLKYGGDIAVSAMGAFMGWDSLLFLPVISIGEAVQALYSYNWGAGKPDRVLSALKWALALASGYFAFSILLVYFLVRPMLMLFTSDATLLVVATEGMLISYSTVIFAGIALMAGSFFQSLGLAKLSLFLTLCRQVIFLIPPVFILPPVWGVKGVWFCFPVVDTGGGMAAFFLLLLYYKKLGLSKYESGGLRNE